MLSIKTYIDRAIEDSKLSDSRRVYPLHESRYYGLTLDEYHIPYCDVDIEIFDAIKTYSKIVKAMTKAKNEGKKGMWTRGLAAIVCASATPITLFAGSLSTFVTVCEFKRFKIDYKKAKDANFTPTRFISDDYLLNLAFETWGELHTWRLYSLDSKESQVPKMDVAIRWMAAIRSLNPNILNYSVKSELLDRIIPCYCCHLNNMFMADLETLSNNKSINFKLLMHAISWVIYAHSLSDDKYKERFPEIQNLGNEADCIDLDELFQSIDNNENIKTTIKKAEKILSIVTRCQGEMSDVVYLDMLISNIYLENNRLYTHLCQMNKIAGHEFSDSDSKNILKSLLYINLARLKALHIKLDKDQSDIEDVGSDASETFEMLTNMSLSIDSPIS